MNIFKAFILIFAFLAVSQIYPWNLKKDSNGVKVFTRKVQGFSIEEYRGEVEIQGSLEGLIKLVQDMPACSQWIEYCKEGKLIKKESNFISYTYTETSLPWPMDNRDAVVKNILTLYPGGKGAKIDFTSSPNYIPPVSGIRRIQKIKGFWEFSKLENGNFKVTYQVLSDPENIPAWMVNMGIVDQPYITLKNMKTFIKKDKYR
ncbi:MAG: START domain-containing protein [Spirochaetia bacterium]|nr:START domain-containing protein [Spirochaetia bacterium]